MCMHTFQGGKPQLHGSLEFLTINKEIYMEV